jgi:hypothetical protein
MKSETFAGHFSLNACYNFMKVQRLFAEDLACWPGHGIKG